jgi:hypothetical protein
MLIKNTSEKMGDKFLPYNGFNNNCQNFIINMLQANGINEGEEFVSQKVGGILKDHPYVKQFINLATELGGRYDVIKQGGAEGESDDNGLYADDIPKILRKNGYEINGVFSKDKLPVKCHNGWYVVNLQSTNQGNKHGSHWVCFEYKNGDMMYFDAFGFPPPIEIMRRCSGNILYSTKEIQDINATSCGWFVIGAIISDNGYGNQRQHFNRYINMFSSNTHLNDGILSKFLCRNLK